MDQLLEFSADPSFDHSIKVTQEFKLEPDVLSVKDYGQLFPDVFIGRPESNFSQSNPEQYLDDAD